MLGPFTTSPMMQSACPLQLLTHIASPQLPCILEQLCQRLAERLSETYVVLGFFTQ